MTLQQTHKVLPKAPPKTEVFEKRVPDNSLNSDLQIIAPHAQIQQQNIQTH